MKKIVLIGNINNINSGPGYVVNSIESYLRENNYEFETIDTCHKNFRLLFRILKLIFYKNTIVNVHSFGYKIPYLVMLISRINKSNSYFMTLHGIMSIENKINGLPYPEKIERKLIERFPNIICVSEYQKKVLIEKFSREEKVFVCNNGCDFYKEEYKNKKNIDDTITFVDAGGFSKRKNALEVLRIVKELKDNNFKCKYIVFGSVLDEIYYNDCIKYVNDNNIKDCFEYKGKIDRSKLIDMYLNSNYCIALSKFDTFNMTVLEAMQTGTPIIISKDTGIATLLENKDVGLILDDIDTKKVIDFFNKNKLENKYDLLCKNAYDIGKKYSKSNMIKEYLKVFKESEKNHRRKI